MNRIAHYKMVQKMTKKCHRFAKMYKNAGHRQRQTDR